MAVSSHQIFISDVLHKSPLDDSQKQFCADPRGAVRLLAPAGCGKTYSLLWRCLNLYNISKEKPRFLVFTFTRVARDELRERLKTDPNFLPIHDRVEIMTLNSWGYRRIKLKKQNLRLCITQGDQITCIFNILQPIWKIHPSICYLLENTRAKGWTAKTLMDLIDFLKSLGFRHDQHDKFGRFKKHIEWLIKAGLKNHVLAFFKHLENLGIINNIDRYNDFNLLFEEIHQKFMPFWCDATEALYQTSFITLEDQKYWAFLDVENQVNEDKFSSGMHRFQYILVDEFQDINVLDLYLLRAIARFNKTALTIVGDDDQAIFEWRGASPRFILDPDAFLREKYTTYILNSNYRSPRNIVEYSQKLIQNNRHRVRKKIVAQATENAKIKVRVLPSLLHSIDFVVETVQKLLKKKDIKNIAIIGRKRSQIIPYQIIFASKSIPFYAAEDLQLFLSDAFHELKNMLAIKARANLDSFYGIDPVADIIKLCQKVKRYPLSRKDMEGLRRYLLRKKPATLNDALIALSKYNGPLKYDTTGRMALKYTEAISQFLKTDTVSEAINAISEYFEGLQKDYGKSLEDIFYVDPPFLYLSEYAERYGDDYRAFIRDVEEAIGTLALVPSDDLESVEKEKPWNIPLHLMTALRAKGKEFDVVFILDANQGIWPSKLAKTEDEMEQERRLFYVAFTRARKQLYILVNKTILGEPVLPTPYLAEMGLDIEE